ncbi:MAG: PqqD family protein [Candidatus Roizmanbacteria bacterium]|nr:PqqD family protein [Candidatus Roizmanbacteria bacterium]
MLNLILSRLIEKTMKYIIDDKVFTKKINDRVLILKEGEDFYRELNETASMIWESIKNKQNMASIINIFTKIYGVDRNTAKKDINDFVQNYIKLGLLKKS